LSASAPRTAQTPHGPINYWGYQENPFWNPQFSLLNRRGFDFFGVWDLLYHATLSDARFADREAGIAP
jgi:hypothetical protein